MKEYTFEIKNNSAVAKTLALLVANFSTLNPTANIAKGNVTKTTSADGEITIPHGLTDELGNGVTPEVAVANVEGDNVNVAKVISRGTSDLTVLVVDAAGADVAATEVTVSYFAMATKARKKLYNDAQEIKDAGYGADIAADDGVIFSDATGDFKVIAADDEKTYRTFLNEMRMNINQLRRIRMSANNVSAFSEYLILQRTSMLDDEGGKKKYLLENYRGLDQNVQDSVIIDLDYPVNSETLGTLPVRSGDELKVTFYFD